MNVLKTLHRNKYANFTLKDDTSNANIGGSQTTMTRISLYFFRTTYDIKTDQSVDSTWPIFNDSTLYINSWKCSVSAPLLTPSPANSSPQLLVTHVCTRLYISQPFSFLSSIGRKRTHCRSKSFGLYIGNLRAAQMTFASLKKGSRRVAKNWREPISSIRKLPIKN